MDTIICYPDINEIRNTGCRMTPQEVFETVAKHLFKQGRRSTDSAERCVYRLERGDRVLMCAVGCLIPKSHYRTSMEHKGVDGLVTGASRLGYTVPRVIRRNAELLELLQEAHDQPRNWYTSAAMRNRLKAIAPDFDLDPDFLDTLSFADGR